MTTHSPPTRLIIERAARLGRLIHQRRLELGFGTTEFAKKATISNSYVWYIEEGRIEHIRLDKFCKIAEVLHIPADELLREAGYLPPQPESPLPEPDDYLRQTYHLGPEGMRQAIEFLEFLSQREQALMEKNR